MFICDSCGREHGPHSFPSVDGRARMCGRCAVPRRQHEQPERRAGSAPLRRRSLALTSLEQDAKADEWRRPAKPRQESPAEPAWRL